MSTPSATNIFLSKQPENQMTTKIVAISTKTPPDQPSLLNLPVNCVNLGKSSLYMQSVSIPSTKKLTNILLYSPSDKTKPYSSVKLYDNRNKLVTDDPANYNLVSNVDIWCNDPTYIISPSQSQSNTNNSLGISMICVIIIVIMFCMGLSGLGAFFYMRSKKQDGGLFEIGE